MFQIFFRIFLFLTLSICSIEQGLTQRGDIRMMFYNLENLFDTIDNPDTRDDEFLPNGERKWDSYRYWKKIKHTYQVVAAAGEQKPPEILGVCEVESFLPLYNLAQNTHLSKYPYTIIHKDSPDRRGIDVAILYQKDKVKLLSKEFITVRFPSDTNKRTRDILRATFKIKDDTLHVFVNHWPSRMGGQAYSEPFRIHVASIILSKIDSIVQTNPSSNIIVMGDLNDEPDNASLDVLTNSNMINLSESLKESCSCGTYRYKSHWNMLDQVVVSPELTNDKGLHLLPGSLKIFKPDFLLEVDEKNGGMKPYRTYIGPQYIGGYSDHLPILLDLHQSSSK